MDDLHSIAYRSSTTNSSLTGVGGGGWDFHHLGTLDTFATLPSSPVTENTPPFLSFPDFGDVSTGYLQDALFNYNSKRRRLLLFDDYDEDEGNNSRSCLLDKGNRNLMNCYENYDCLSQITKCDSISGEGICKSGSRISNEESSVFTEIKIDNNNNNNYNYNYNNYYNYNNHLDEEAISAFHYRKFSDDKHGPPTTFSSGSREEKQGRKRAATAMTKLAYPFAVVKPGGREGDVTLNEINERIMMPPTRPVKHPVGDFACRPLVSPDGPGLSGKAVVAFTRIHTQGRGTITIIRTRG